MGFFIVWLLLFACVFCTKILGEHASACDYLNAYPNIGAFYLWHLHPNLDVLHVPKLENCNMGCHCEERRRRGNLSRFIIVSFFLRTDYPLCLVTLYASLNDPPPKGGGVGECIGKWRRSQWQGSAYYNDSKISTLNFKNAVKLFAVGGERVL